jgi:23S rRNA (cytosine1962-C5)-methyltransferase
VVDRVELVENLFPHAREAWILHHDEDLIAIDKPAYLSTHAPEPDRVDDARSRLAAFLIGQGVEDPYLGVHQRLDKGTSGVLVFARRKQANASMAKQFEGRLVRKTYLAAVTVDKIAPKGTLRNRLVPGDPGAMKISLRGGQEAITRFEVVRRKKGRAIVRCFPETGRTHQIRVQLAAIGAPVGGDRLYGGAPSTRLLLHASALGLDHPGTGARLEITAPIPAAFDAWLDGEPDPFASVEVIEAVMREATDARYGIGRDLETTALRLLNGAGDGLPGVALDLYGEHLVASIGEEVPAERRAMVLDAAARLGAKGVYVKVRPKHASVVTEAAREELLPKHAVRGDDAPESFEVKEQGLSLEVRLGEGFSTGLFLDQRENRRRVRASSEGARVLNLFSYTGAFTVAAVRGGARSSVTVDVAHAALDWARKNLELAGADPKLHEIVEADALAWLGNKGARGEAFDLVILDPPSFATTKKSRFSAEDDYAMLAAKAMRQVAPGGRLLAATNHKGIFRGRFRRNLHEAAREAGREVVQMKDLPDPVDFPAEPGAEPHLKSLLVTLK